MSEREDSLRASQESSADGTRCFAFTAQALSASCTPRPVGAISSVVPGVVAPGGETGCAHSWMGLHGEGARSDLIPLLPCLPSLRRALGWLPSFFRGLWAGQFLGWQDAGVNGVTLHKLEPFAGDPKSFPHRVSTPLLLFCDTLLFQGLFFFRV